MDVRGGTTTFIDLFAGIGGFHFALHRQGAVCVFSSEWDNECRKTYTENFKKISPQIFKLFQVRTPYSKRNYLLET